MTDNTPLETRTTLANKEAYKQLSDIAARDDVNDYRKKAINDYLAASYRCNLTPAALQSEASPVDSLETASKNLETSTSSPTKIIVYFAGTGNPIGLKDSLFDEHIIETLSDESEGNQPIVIAMPGVGISRKNGDISSWDIITGKGMAERVQDAYNTIKKYTNTNPDVDIQIMGHSRGALQAIALGKMLAAENIKSSVMAHEPVLGSKTSGAALNAKLVSTNDLYKYTFKGILDDSKQLERLFVMTRQDENRGTAFKVYDTPNAYKSNFPSTYMANHPGYHNIGVFKGRTTSLNVDIMFSKWYSFPYIKFSSKPYNQDTPVIDGHRDGFKAFMYNEYKGLFKAFFSGDLQLHKKIEDSHKRITQHHFSDALTKNPAYAKMQESIKRDIPEKLIDKSIQAQQPVQKGSLHYNLNRWNQHADSDDEDAIKSDLLEQYKELIECKPLTNEKQIVVDNIFAILSEPNPWYMPLSTHYSQKVRAINPVINEPKKSNGARYGAMTFLGVAIAAVMTAVFVPPALKMIVPLAIAVGIILFTTAAFYYGMKLIITPELVFSDEHKEHLNAATPKLKARPSPENEHSSSLLFSGWSSQDSDSDSDLERTDDPDAPLTLKFTGTP